MTKTKILIADDDRGMLSSLAIRLRASGYEVFCAQNGYLAVAAAKKHSPDLLLLDVNMPAGDGLSVHERVSHLDNMSGTPVVYLTGGRSEGLWDTMHSMGAFALIRKPFDTEILLSVIAGALESRLVPCVLTRIRLPGQ